MNPSVSAYIARVPFIILISSLFSDWVKMELPTYPKIVKRPMDMSTMRRKLENHDYPTAQRFYDDFKLMIKNCKLFNPVGTPVCTAGQELDRVFEEKWRQLPPLHPVQVSDDDDDDDLDDLEYEAERLREYYLAPSIEHLAYDNY